MDDSNPTSIIKMINDLRSGSDSCRPSSVSFRLSGTSAIGDLSFSDSSKDELNTPKRPRLSSITSSQSKESAPCSPWEWQKTKGEIISMKSKLSHQEVHIQQLHNIRRQLEEMFEKEKAVLKLKADENKQMIKQLELRVDVNRRTIQELRDAKMMSDRELQQVKMKLENQLVAFEDEKLKLLQKSQESSLAQDSRLDVTSEIEKEAADLKMQLELSNSKVKNLEEKLRELRESQANFELQSLELHSAKMKVEKLESERSLWEEGQQMILRASKAATLEKDLAMAMETIASLREAVKGKLLLEEQMSSVAPRMERLESLEQKVIELESNESELLSRLKEYESIGISGGPSALKREINRLQQAEAVLSLEEGQLRSKADSALKECQILTKKYDEAKKQMTESARSTEQLNKLVSRLQRKTMLVTREREVYRQQLDMYEKESTIDPSNAMAERIPALEASLSGYRDLVKKLEADLEAALGTGQQNEYKKLREEIEPLRNELKYRALKGDFNCNAKILHLAMNPSVIAAQQAEDKQKALELELEELRAKVAAGNTSDSTVSSLQAQEMEELKQKNELKITRLKEAFRVSSSEYRHACYCLFGWRVDRVKEGSYKLFSQYAESPDDYLSFKVDDENGVELLETPFSATLASFVETYLHKQRSVPMFLIAVQQELYSQQTNVMQ